MIWHHAFWLGRVFREIRQDRQITRVLGQQVGMFRHVGKIKFHTLVRYLRLAAVISFCSFLNSECSDFMGPTNIRCCNRESSAGRYAAFGRIVVRVLRAADSAPRSSMTIFLGNFKTPPEYEDDEKGLVRSRQEIPSSNL